MVYLAFDCHSHDRSPYNCRIPQHRSNLSSTAEFSPSGQAIPAPIILVLFGSEKAGLRGPRELQETWEMPRNHGSRRASVSFQPCPETRPYSAQVTGEIKGETHTASRIHARAPPFLPLTRPEGCGEGLRWEPYCERKRRPAAGDHHSIRLGRFKRVREE